MKHITIQAIFAKYPLLYNYIADWGRNNYRNIFFIDPATAGGEIPTIYIMMAGRLYTNYIRHGGIRLRHVSFHDEKELWAQALAEAHKAVESRHPYLAPVLEQTETIWGITPSNSLF